MEWLALQASHNIQANIIEKEKLLVGTCLQSATKIS